MRRPWLPNFSNEATVNQAANKLSAPDQSIEVERTAGTEVERSEAVLTVQRTQADLSLPLLMRKVVAEHGKSFNQLFTDFAKLGFGPGKLSVEEYFDLRLFDDVALAGADKRQFVGLDVMRQLWDQVNFDQTWYGIMNDKLASATLLGAYGFPVIPVVAIYAPSLSLPKPPCCVIDTAGALRAFMQEPANYPMFGKPADALQSLGSMSFDGYDPATGVLTAVDGSDVALETFIADVTAHYQKGYLFQKRLLPHAAIRAICGNRLATVRIVTINPKTGPEILRTAWKIPAGANAADNFWRTGNLLGEIDIETGRIKRVVRGKGIDQVELQAHPDSGATIVNFQLPMWEQAKTLALEGMKVFPKMGMIGWDIAITDDGPVIVEPNETPDHMLPQIADRRGIMDDRFRAYVAERKADFAALQQATRRQMRAEGRNKLQRVSADIGKQ
jgi:Sugar-transfer associated ATP-grasp